MNSKHLSDDTIQSFILKENIGPNTALHISECAYCRARLEAYRNLIEGIDELDPESFSFDASAIVMNRIKAYENNKAKFWTYTLITLLSLAFLGILVLSIPILQPIFLKLKSMSSMTNGLIIISGLSSMAFLIMDMLRQYKQKEKLISLSTLQPKV